MTLFGGTHGCGSGGWGGKKTPTPKTCHTYPTIMKLGTVMSYLKKMQKAINLVTHLLSSANMSTFFIGNQQIYLY